MSFSVEYADAPIDKVGVIEVYGTEQLQGVLREGEQGNRVHLEVGPAIAGELRGSLAGPCKARAKPYKTATSNRSGRRLNGGPLSSSGRR